MPLQRGKKASLTQPAVSDIRLLSRAELSVLAQARPFNGIQNLRDNHHRIARAMAAGLNHGEIASLCGISNSRVSVLKQDPAFMDLVAHYRSVVTAEFARELDPVIDYLGSVRAKSLAQIEAKLDAADEANELLPTRELVAIAELGLDRTGYGKVNKNLNVNVDFAANLERARQRSSRARVIESSPLAPAPVPAQSAPGPLNLPAAQGLPSRILRRV